MHPEKDSDIIAALQDVKKGKKGAFMRQAVKGWLQIQREMDFAVDGVSEVYKNNELFDLMDFASSAEEALLA